MNKHPGFIHPAVVIALTVALIGCSKTPDATPTAQPAAAASAALGNVSDIDVTEHVKTALLTSEPLKGADITVVTLKGDVRLIGTLGSQAQIDEAIRIARAADGAHSIHNELTLKP